MATARTHRRPAPKARTATADSVTPKASVWTRIKATASRALGAVKRAFTKTAAVVAKPFKAVARGTRTFVYKRPRLAFFFARVKAIATRFWVRALRPLLRMVVYGAMITAVAIGLYVSPVLTIAIIVGLGLFFHGLAAVVERLEKAEANGSRAARWTLTVFAVIEGLFDVATYLGAAAALVAMCIASVPFAIYAALHLVLNYFAVPGASTLSFVAFCLMTGDLPLAIIWFALYGWQDVLAIRAAYRNWKTRRQNASYTAPIEEDVVVETSAEVPPATETPIEAVIEAPAAAVDAEVVVPPSEVPLRAQGVEEMQGSTYDMPVVLRTCAVCPAQAETLTPSLVILEGDRDICPECAASEVAEATALKHTGVSRAKRGIVVPLLREGIEASTIAAASRADIGSWHWLVTAEFRDTDGSTSPREWSVLGNGVVHATVRYHYKRNAVQGFDLNKRLVCTVPVLKGEGALVKAVASAQLQVTDELDRRDNLREKSEREPVAAPTAAPLLFTVAGKE